VARTLDGAGGSGGAAAAAAATLYASPSSCRRFG